MNSTKKQKDITLKDQTPRSVGIEYATEEQKNSSRRKKELSQSGKQCIVMDVSGGETKD